MLPDHSARPTTGHELLSRARSVLRIAPTLLLTGIVSAQLGCGQGSAENGEPAQSNGAQGDTLLAAADSTLADSTLADSTAVDSTQGGKRSWTQRFFGGDGDEDSEAESKPEQPAVPVELAEVLVRDMPAFLTSTATLEPEKEAQILSKTGGEILEIQTEEGDWVKEGAILSRLDGSTQKALLVEAEARANGLRANYDRLLALHEQELASEKDLTTARTDWEQAEAARQVTELEHVHTIIRAPFSGQISQRMVDPGQTVSENTHLFTIVDADPLLARIYLPEREVTRLEPEQGVVVTSDSDPDLRMTGNVLRVAPIVDTRTGTVKVTCQVDGNHASLRPGSFIRVQIQTGLHESVRAIPKKAIVAEGSESYVYKAEADSVVKVRVATGFTDDQFVEVVEGLDEGDRVVSVGHGGLKEGTKVRDLTSRETSGSDSTKVTNEADTAAADL